jgi:hypothetical protein
MYVKSSTQGQKPWLSRMFFRAGMPRARTSCQVLLATVLDASMVDSFLNTSYNIS